MAPLIVLDTGPLVALLNKAEREHSRVVRAVQGLRSPFLTAEHVLTEACFLLRNVKGGARAVLGLVGDGLVRVGLAVEEELEPIQTLMTKYADVPMSLADACLVRLAEQHDGARVFTFDSDFGVYRRQRHRRVDQLEY